MASESSSSTTSTTAATTATSQPSNSTSGTPTTEPITTTITTTIIPTDADTHESLPLIEIIGIVASVVLVGIVIIVTFIACRRSRRRKKSAAPSVPKVNAHGLTDDSPAELVDSTDSRYQPWRTTGEYDNNSTDDPRHPHHPHRNIPPLIASPPNTQDPDVYRIGDNDSTSPTPPQPPSAHHKPQCSPPHNSAAGESSGGRESSVSNVYMNYKSQSSSTSRQSSSSVGTYITCPNSRPDSVPGYMAPGFDGKPPPPAAARARGELDEDLYMPMDMAGAFSGGRQGRGQASAAGNPDDGIYTEPAKPGMLRGVRVGVEEKDEDGEEIYTAPDQPLPPPPPPCGVRPYINVPETGQPAEEGGGGGGGEVDKGDYQNLPSTGYVYDNLPQSKKPKVVRSESLKNMDSSKGLSGKSSAKQGGAANLQKAHSMSQVLSAMSGPRIAPKKLTDQSIPEHSSQSRLCPENNDLSDSSSEDGGDCYQNVPQNENKDYMNVPDKKKEEPKSESNSSNGGVSTTSAPSQNSPSTAGTKPAKTGGRIPVCDKKTPSTNHKPAMPGTKPGFDNKKGATGNAKKPDVNKKPVISGKKATGMNPSTKPFTTPPAAKSPVAAMGIKPSVVTGKKQPAGLNKTAVCVKSSDIAGVMLKDMGKAGVGRKAEGPGNSSSSSSQPASELEKILAKRRQNNGES